MTAQPNPSSDPQSPHEDVNRVTSANSMTRREAVPAIVAAGAGAVAFMKGFFTLKNAHASTKNASAAETSTESTDHAEHPHDLPAWLDLGTAGLVATRFFHNVVAPGLVEAFSSDAEKVENDPDTVGKVNSDASAAKKKSSILRRVLLGTRSSKDGLDSVTATEMNALAFGRIAALSTLGGKEGQHLAGHELAEIQSGLIPLPILVLLSDATNEALKINEAAIFAANSDSLEGQPEEVKQKAGFIKIVQDFLKSEAVEDYAAISRPSLGDTPEAWEKHRTKVNGDISTKVGQIVAVTSVLGPIGTTYTSSLLANEMKQSVLRMLYEQAYAEQVVERKSKGDEMLEHSEIEDAAIAKADDMFNGKWGFSKLMLTLAANTQGSWGLGDPPEIYFALNNLNKPDVLAKGHAVGALTSEIYSLALTALWLKKAGVDVKDSLGTLLKGQLKTVGALAQTVGKSDLRNVSFREGKGMLDRIRAALTDQNDPTGKLRATLDAIPAAKLQFSPAGYLRKKAAQLTGLQGKLSSIPDGAVANADDFANSDLWSALLKGDAANVGDLLKTAEAKIQGVKAEELAALLGQVMESKATDVTASTGPEEGVESAATTVDPVSAAEVEQTLRSVSELQTSFLGQPKDLQDQRLTEAREILGLSADERDPAQVYAALGKVDDTTIYQALAKFTKVGNGEHDAVPGHDHVAHAGETVAEAMHDTTAAHSAKAQPTLKEKVQAGIKNKLENNRVVSALNHSAKEVLWALLTQIPSVPAIVRLASVGLPKMVGVAAGEKPSTGQLKAIVGATLTMSAAKSAVADNVAAYMFCRTVLFDFFKSTFGDKVFEIDPNLEGEIDIIAAKIAEQAGSLTKVGNGPNFSQKRYVLLKDETVKQGVSLDEQAMTMGETLPHNNVFSTVANVSLVAMCTAWLSKRIDDVAASMQAKPADVAVNRRDALKRLFGGNLA